MNLPDLTVRNRRLSRVAIAVVAGGGLALGVSGLARADDPAPAPPAAAPAQAHTPHLDGTVKSIGGGHILVVDREGFTRQINFTGTPSGVKVGARIHAEGTVNADGVSLDAKTVGVAPEPPAGRPGKDGPRGPHGPRGEGRKPGEGAPPAPSGSDAPSAPPAPSGSDAPSAPPAPSGSDAPSAPPAAPVPSATS